ncbi:Ig-like protein group 4 [Kineococcus xinjiangensis]|uniref:Ig-like protein group 4 n=1 Tax=Kineococcus xinjiangensis TaxID=512762 RepID=A0A2S6IE16_9ACTN|nr:Ig-like domain-containing protein [Kineococcus xinjiangensis]PPK92465.1 Ig-like protein group 4 [Kineococcus xinjiangensis]
MSSRTSARLLAGLGAVAVVATTAAAPTAAAPTAAAPTAAATAASSAQAANAVTVRPDPSYQGPEFQGWGTSLVWFANATGGYSDEVREELYRLLFSEEGLNLNIARYNIGGGHAPDVPDYLRPGSAVPGWWRAPAGVGLADKDWWNPDDPAHWDLDADPRQRWWVDRIKGDITKWETFSNSPPYFQTVSGYVSGGLDPAANQLRPESVEEFAAYLVRATEHLEQAHGIEVATVDPFNEPGTTYWSTKLGADGRPLPTKQEGAHISTDVQHEVVRALAERLQASPSGAVVSAMDETDPQLFAAEWATYPDDVRAAVAQLNVHTYGTRMRTAVRDIAKGEDKPLWMSEVEGSFLSGWNPTSMVPGLGIAERMADDLRELEPEAWVFWQPVENHDLTRSTPTQAGSNWGSIHVPFSCSPADTLARCPVVTNTKYDTARNFTHYIRPGDRLVAVDDTSSAAAVTKRGATVVHVNDGTAPRTVTLDLTGFRKVAGDAQVTPVVTTAGRPLVQGAPVRVVDGRATVEVPAQSVTTFLVEGVSGAAAEQALVQDRHTYRLRGVQSGRSLTAGADGRTAVRTDDADDAAQLWRLDAVAAKGTNRARYAVTSVADGRRLSVAAGAPVLVPAEGEPDAAAQWIASTTGDGTVTLVNVATGRLLEVGGRATADGSPVTTYRPTSGANQLWTLVDETVTGIRPVEAFTVPGVAPVLPGLVVPVHPDGAGASLPVTWNPPPEPLWRKPGIVEVRGTATDAAGRRHRARAEVVVDTLTSTLPAAARTFAGGEPELPATVAAVGSLGREVQRPVTWHAPPEGAYSRVGVVTVTGTADAGDGRRLDATARVTVTEPVEENAALAPGVVATATFTERGYSPAALHDGRTTDKAWSNWKPGTKNPSDTVTTALPAPRHVAKVRAHSYRDGTESYPARLLVQTRTGDGEWVDAAPEVAVPSGGATAPVVEVAFPPRRVDAVRVVMTARPGTYMTMSEIEVIALAPAP